MWSQKTLWKKTVLYIQRSSSTNRDDQLFPFWRFLALEFLARAAISNVHPSLLADGKDSKNILFACGHKLQGNPKQISITEVLNLCQIVIKNFTEEDKKLCMSWIDLRNKELHTGDSAFLDFKSSTWLAQYYKVTKVLCKSQKKDLKDLLGTDEAKTAEKMISALESNVKKEVMDAISRAKIFFQNLKPKEVETHVKEAIQEGQVRSLMSRTKKLHDCPSCGHKGIMEGEIVFVGDTYLDNQTLLSDITVLPTKFTCHVCRLNLLGLDRLHAAGIGGQYSIKTVEDPVEYFQIEQDYYEPEPEYMDE